MRAPSSSILDKLFVNNSAEFSDEYLYRRAITVNELLMVLSTQLIALFNTFGGSLHKLEFEMQSPFKL